MASTGGRDMLWPRPANLRQDLMQWMRREKGRDDDFRSAAAAAEEARALAAEEPAPKRKR